MRKNIQLIALSILIMSAGIACKKKKKEESETSPTNAAPAVSIEFLEETVIIGDVAEKSKTTGGYGINVNATASDSDGSVSKVEFYVNETKVSEDTEAPYELRYSSGEVNNTIYAKAYDNAGASTKSNELEADFNM